MAKSDAEKAEEQQQQAPAQTQTEAAAPKSQRELELERTVADLQSKLAAVNANKAVISGMEVAVLVQAKNAAYDGVTRKLKFVQGQALLPGTLAENAAEAAEFKNAGYTCREIGRDEIQSLGTQMSTIEQQLLSNLASQRRGDTNNVAAMVQPAPMG